MAEIMINPEKFGELSEYYSNNFDAKYKDATGRYEETIGRLATTWEGEEANTANDSYRKIKESFRRIEERSEDIKRIVASKSEGFNETIERTRTGFNGVNNDGVRF